jgi:hypothetical protein
MVTSVTRCSMGVLSHFGRGALGRLVMLGERGNLPLTRAVTSVPATFWIREAAPQERARTLRQGTSRLLENPASWLVVSCLTLPLVGELGCRSLHPTRRLLLQIIVCRYWVSLCSNAFFKTFSDFLWFCHERGSEFVTRARSERLEAVVSRLGSRGMGNCVEESRSSKRQSAR